MTREEADRMMDSVIREMTDEWEGGPLREDALGVWQGESYIRRVHHAGWALTRFAVTESLIRFNEIKAWDGKLPVYMAGEGTTTVPVLQLGEADSGA